MRIKYIKTKYNKPIGTFKQGKVYVYKYDDAEPYEVYLLCTEVGLINLETGALFEELLPGSDRYTSKLAKYAELKVVV